MFVDNFTTHVGLLNLLHFFVSIKGIKSTTDDESEDEFYPPNKQVYIVIALTLVIDFHS